MAKLSGFNANDHEPMKDFSSMPAGDYFARITESDLIENKNKTGSYLKLTFVISQGKFKSRKLWTNLNIIHTNPEAVEIAESQLATIMKSVGKVAVQDSEELHGIDLKIKVVVKKATSNFPESNEIKNYYPADGVGKPSNSSTSDAPKKSKRVSFDD